MDQVISYISSVGFPIVACFFLWKSQQETMSEFRQTIQENTKMLQKLANKLDKEGKA